GTVGWAVRDRAARDHDQQVREVALDGEVNRALDETGPLIDQGKWPEALAVVERADKLLAAAGRTDRPPQLMQLHKELSPAQRLENIYQGARPQREPRPWHSLEEDFFWGREQDARFAGEFRDFGIDIDALAPAEAAARIGRTGIRTTLVQALDEWAALRKR